jgi:methylated-DNA-[protein]-cysteine S-methyltransferase
MESTLSTCRMESPLGEILLVANSRGDALCGLYLERQKYFPVDADQWHDAPKLPVLRDGVAQLREYFAGTRTRFDVPVAPVGTPFQRDVWAAIGNVPFGETITYAELARRCGRPSAVRAAGAATGRNPITIVIPCHRIVGGDGSLTGYAGGLERKRALLELEARDTAPKVRKVA